MKKNAAAKVVVASPEPRGQIAPLGKALSAARAKIREDLFRFRTCCADPRASK